MKIKQKNRKSISKKWRFKFKGITKSNIFVNTIVIVILFLFLIGIIMIKIIEKRKKLTSMITIKMDIKKQIIKKTYTYE